MTEQFVIGLVGAPFGLKGHVKVRPFSGDLAHLVSLESLTLRQGEKERPLRIEESAAHPPVVLFKFAGFDSPEAAKTLSGAELLVGREHASPLRAGEFYVEDLKGLPVEAADNGEILGHVADIVEGGGGELVEIRLFSENSGGELKLVPFRKEFFAETGLERGRLTLLNRWILA